ncbi:MAG TPA: MBL fold metallo-hydrolase [Acidimicrobiales bacterium]|nr:MBL fold metallo-hydrolase [Acidimicrobiales bacterium]
MSKKMVPGATVQVSPLVRRILAPNPTIFTGPGTNTYLLGHDEVAVIDPGPIGCSVDEWHLDRVATAGAGRIRWILVTHTHPDHAPGAAGLAQRTGAEIVGYDARDDFTPDTEVGDGWELSTGEFHLRAVHTPGHASNHLCYLLETERALFSGDHIMSGSTVVIRPPDGDMAAYMEALARLETLRPPPLSIAPGHGQVIDDPAAKVREYTTHRRAREAAILAALTGAGRATVEEIVPTVYVDVDEEHQAIARYSVWAHLRKLAADGRVRSPDVDDLASTWEPVLAGP